jgi:hypothetical protein
MTRLRSIITDIFRVQTHTYRWTWKCGLTSLILLVGCHP